MAIVKWLVLGLGTAASGALYVQYLTVHPVKMGRAQLAATVSLLAAGLSLFLGFRGVELWIALPFGLGLALAGYTWMTHRVLAREDPRSVPELTRGPGDPGLGHTAVIYFTHGEPETYDPIGWINQFREFDEHGIRFVPFLVRPLFIHHLRKIYLIVGRSNHRQMHQRMLHALERAYRAQGDETTRFYICFLDDEPRPDAAVVQALNEGASRIIVSEVFLTISNHTAEGKELIEDLPLQAYDVPIVYTGPLWDSEPLREMFVARADAHLDGTDKARVGILLVGHGQPDEWDNAWPTETAQEIAFREGVLERFAGEGYRPENLSMAWMEFKEPRPAAKIEAFVRNGVEKVFYYSAAISADALHSQYDVPHLISQARAPDGIELVNLGAWNDDPLVIRAIKEKIDARTSSS
jgi:sirohydrochlorin ferrochelatase/type IV secretory pathway TrbD component